MNLILSLIAILVVCHLLVFLGKKIKVPEVVMLIIAGLIFNIVFLKNWIISENSGVVSILGDAGLFFLMFLAGLEVSLKQMYKERKNSILIALFASILPFSLGVLSFSLLGFSILTSAMVGIGMAITAEATTANVLIDLKKIKTKIGAAMIGAGIADDIIGIGLFVIISILFSAGIFEQIITIGAIMSFFLGILSHRIMRKTKEKNILEEVGLFFIVPFFFVSVGINFNLNSLILNPIILLVIVSIAIIGKIGGVFLTKPFTKFKNKQALLIGWAMNSRGAIELALALVAFKIGLLNTELYSGIVLMALITTLIFPFIITHMINKYKKIMD